MKLRTKDIDGVTYAEVMDGKPVYEAEDGKIIPFDAPGTVATITRLNGEAKGHRTAKETAEAALKTFEGITDPVAAIKALETVSALDQKKLIDAGAVDAVKAEMAKGYQEKLDAAQKHAATLEAALYGEKIGGAFARSRFIADKVAIPAEFVQARFGERFKIEDGNVVAYGQDGNKIYSRSRPGELPDFDEALEILVTDHPTRDQILRGDIKGGGGAQQGGNRPSGGRTVTRAELATLAPSEQMRVATDPATTLVD